MREQVIVIVALNHSDHLLASPPSPQPASAYLRTRTRIDWRMLGDWLEEASLDLPNGSNCGQLSIVTKTFYE